MPSFVTPGHSIDEVVHLIRNSHSRLAHVSRLISAIELDVQQGQSLNLEALIQLAQRRCATIRDDLGQQIEQLQWRLDEIKGEGSNGTCVSPSLLPPSGQHDHIDWLVALSTALRPHEHNSLSVDRERPSAERSTQTPGG